MNDILPARPQKSDKPNTPNAERALEDQPIIRKSEQSTIHPEPELPEIDMEKEETETMKKKRFNIVDKLKNLSKKQKIILIVVLLLFLGGGTAAALVLTRKEAPQQKAAAPAETPAPPKPETEASKLTGVQVKPELNKRPVTGIMIENSPDARPQSGLKDAGVVFEAIAEGGITRFLTLFQESQPDYIGPVRSVRPYYLDWLQGFDAAVAHVGGSSDGLAKIRTDGVKDLDQSANAGAFWRVSNRYAPHNMYTSMAKLDELQQKKGFTSSNFQGFPRKDDQPAATPTARTIDLNISGFLYNPRYDYDQPSNSYKRSEAGKPHIDEKSGAIIQPKVVVVPVITYGIAANRVNSVYGTIGSGKVFVFQDGGMTEGTWEKTSSKSQITFKDASGNPIKLNAGQTWVSVVGSADRVSYKP